eukprot:5671062-Amphidinium_carterae.1
MTVVKVRDNKSMPKSSSQILFFHRALTNKGQKVLTATGLSSASQLLLEATTSYYKAARNVGVLFSQHSVSIHRASAPWVYSSLAALGIIANRRLIDTRLLRVFGVLWFELDLVLTCTRQEHFQLMKTLEPWLL